jgi:hypothetical protein
MMTNIALRTAYSGAARDRNPGGLRGHAQAAFFDSLAITADP